MTEPSQPCVNGCVQRRLGDGGEVVEVARLADVGMLCRRCAEKLRTWIRDIPDMYATLDTRPAGGGENQGIKHTKISHSPAPARLDVIALTDPRTVAYSKPDKDSGEKYHDGTVNVVVALTGWARLLCEENDWPDIPTTLVAACRLLDTCYGTLCRQPWIDEAWTEIRDAHRQLSGVIGVERPTLRGNCITVRPKGICGTPIYAYAEAEVKCRRCGRIYKELDQIRLASSRSQIEGWTG